MVVAFPVRSDEPVVKILIEMNETKSQETVSTELYLLLKLKIDKPYVIDSYPLVHWWLPNTKYDIISYTSSLLICTLNPTCRVAVT